jgi:hypothetical protein
MKLCIRQRQVKCINLQVMGIVTVSVMLYTFLIDQEPIRRADIHCQNIDHASLGLRAQTP